MFSHGYLVFSFLPTSRCDLKDETVVTLIFRVVSLELRNIHLKIYSSKLIHHEEMVRSKIFGIIYICEWEVMYFADLQGFTMA